ncbi:MAG TPA: glycosyltransferase family 39 protein [Acidimicrobiia bacterium]|nr:glycosyltransferase family 39 protein [Acidimicrobiia bacterium]
MAETRLEATTRHSPTKLPLALGAIVAALLLAFYIYGLNRDPIEFGLFTHPPVYGHWGPVFHNVGIVVGSAVMLLGIGAFYLARGSHSWMLVVSLLLVGVLAGAGVTLIRGEKNHLTRGVSTSQEFTYYSADIHLVEEYGIVGFAQAHAHLTSEFRSYASKTHPPGTHILLYLLYELWGEHPLRVSTSLALGGLSAGLAAWFTAMSLGGDLEARTALLLFLVTPGALLFAFTAMDLFFAVFMAASAAIFMFSLSRDSPWMSALAGAVLGLATLFTFASAFVAIAAAIAAPFILRDSKRAAVHIAAASGSGLVVLATATVLLGFDFVGSYVSIPPFESPYDPYWIFANPAVVLMFAGLPVVMFALPELFRSWARRSGLFFLVILLGVMVAWGSLPSEITHLRQGEVERTWAFLYPLLAAAAGIGLVRWSSRLKTPIWAVFVVAGLLSIGQAVLIQAHWDTLF